MTAENLNQQHCEACSEDAPRATAAQIAALKPEIPGWEIAEEDGVQRLRRRFSFANYADALAFTARVGEQAEHEGHHPLIVTEWGAVTVEWWSHKIRGLHVNDFVMAARTDHAFDLLRR